MVFFVTVSFFVTTCAEVVPGKRPDASLRGCLTGIEDPQDGLSKSGRGNEDQGYIIIAVMAVVLGVIVGAQNVCDITGGWDTDRSTHRHLPCKICSFFHSLAIFLHSRLPCGSFILILDELERNPTTFRFNELAEDVGNGIILSVMKGEDGIVNSGWSGRGHVSSSSSGNMVFRDVDTPYMHFRGKVQSFELLQCLISKDVIPINPLVL